MSFQPIALVSPDGREWTATTPIEFSNLVYGRGYRIRSGAGDQPTPEPASQPQPAPEQPDQPPVTALPPTPTDPPPPGTPAEAAGSGTTTT
jgi:hypothetical protein